MKCMPVWPRITLYRRMSLICESLWLIMHGFLRAAASYRTSASGRLSPTDSLPNRALPLVAGARLETA